MNVVRPQPWTAEQFFAWAERQDEPYEFDASRPIAMNGGTSCSYFGSNLGVATAGGRIRYPDALVTSARFPGSERLAPDPVVLFEVVSPTSDQRDTVEKVREYAAITSVKQYVIVESTAAAVLVLQRQAGGDSFTAVALTTGDMLSLPDLSPGLSIEIPVAEIFEDIEFQDTAPGS